MSSVFGQIVDQEGHKVGEIEIGDDMLPQIQITSQDTPFEDQLSFLNSRVREGKTLVGSDGIQRVINTDFENSFAQQSTLCTKIESFTGGQYHVPVP